MKVIIPIQSISDLITNSSSELFAIIDANNQEILQNIYQLVYDLFGGDNQELEETPIVTLCRRPTKKEIEDKYNSDYYSYRFNNTDDIYSLPESWIEIELPYRVDHCKLFFKAGLDAILKEKFGNNYKIEYEEF